MTKKIAISVPDDVAERLAKEPNVSAFVTEAVRRQMAGERTLMALRQAGFQITEAGLAEADRKLVDAQAKITPELRTEAASLLIEASGGRMTGRV